MAHITGGGLTENLPRVLPEHLAAVLDRSRWLLPPLFQWLQREGQVADEEMHRVFNCGIGMAVIVAAEHERHAVELLHSAGETVFVIGRIETRGDGRPQTTVN
ncbi:MAG: AIR synthase-related protein, partial [Sterolibacterium sp.]